MLVVSLLGGMALVGAIFYGFDHPWFLHKQRTRSGWRRRGPVVFFPSPDERRRRAVRQTRVSRRAARQAHAMRLARARRSHR